MPNKTLPVDDETIRYLKATGRAKAAPLVEAYAKKQGLWRSKKTPDPIFTDTLELDLSTVESSLAGPKRPQDRVPLTQASSQFTGTMEKEFARQDDGKRIEIDGKKYDVGHGDVVIGNACRSAVRRSVAMMLLIRMPWLLSHTTRPSGIRPSTTGITAPSLSVTFSK